MSIDGYGPQMRLALALLGAATLCSTATAAAPGSLVGRVSVATAEPQCAPKGCGEPRAPLTLRLRSRTTSRVVTTAADGSFRLLLAPGTYRVSVSRGAATTSIAPPSVRIVAGKTLRVRFVLRLGAA
jgi:Carboxypeptidase regulatory-like domain